MSGTPSQAEIETQWVNLVAMFEDAREHFDDVQAADGGLMDVLLQSAEGTYLPNAIDGAVRNVRGRMSEIVSPGVTSSALLAVWYEYARSVLKPDATGGFGSGYSSPADVFRAIFDYFNEAGRTIKSRNITYDTSGTAGGSNAGNGALARVTVDDFGNALEAVTVEKKQLLCRRDQNTSAKREAEVFELSGTAASPDNLVQEGAGSGDGARIQLTARHAGTGVGGSFLSNGSFSNFVSGTGFNNWTVTGGGTVSQDTTTTYRGFPGEAVAASARIDAGGGTTTLTQTLEDMSTTRIALDRPFLARVMVNASAGSGTGGDINFNVGNQQVTVSVASLSAGWNEVLLPLDTNCWPRNFLPGSSEFTVEVEWDSPTSGYVLFDDMLLAPMDLMDGTYWALRANDGTPVPWAVDDILTVTDTGGAPADAKLQWWCVRSGFGYLPSTTGAPSIADPT